MHVWTRLKPESQGKTGIGLYADGMVEHDDGVGALLDKLEELGIADNTIVIYSTDNGAEKFTWPDGGITPFHGEKGTTWEGGFRVPQVVAGPASSSPAPSQRHHLHEDWMPTLLAAAGEPDIKEKLKKGHRANGKTFKRPSWTATTSCPTSRARSRRARARRSSTSARVATSTRSAWTTGRSTSPPSKATSPPAYAASPAGR
jgi:arylsulfatase A-like enzyme